MFARSRRPIKIKLAAASLPEIRKEVKPVIFQKHHFEFVADCRIVVDHVSNAVDQLDDLLRRVIARCRLRNVNASDCTCRHTAASRSRELTFPPIITVLGTNVIFGLSLIRLYMTMMCSALSSCRLYS